MKTYHLDLLSVLLFSNLGCAFFVLVGSHDFGLKLLELFRLCADAFYFFGLASVLDLKSGHFSGELVFDVGLGLVTSGHFINYNC